MSKTFDEVCEDVMKLGDEERRALADTIWESFLTAEEREIQEEWITEAERRYEEMRSGKVKGIPLEDVMAELKAKYGEPRRSS